MQEGLWTLSRCFAKRVHGLVPLLRYVLFQAVVGGKRCWETGGGGGGGLEPVMAAAAVESGDRGWGYAADQGR